MSSHMANYCRHAPHTSQAAAVLTPADADTAQAAWAAASAAVERETCETACLSENVTLWVPAGDRCCSQWRTQYFNLKEHYFFLHLHVLYLVPSLPFFPIHSLPFIPYLAK